MDAAVSLDERCWPAFAKTAADRYQACRVSLVEASAYSKAVWSWHPDAGAKPARNLVSRGDGGKKARTQERAISCQTVAQGRPGLSRPCLWFLPRAFNYARGPRVWRTPGLPCALFNREGDTSNNSDAMSRRENANAHVSGCLKS